MKTLFNSKGSPSALITLAALQIFLSPYTCKRKIAPYGSELQTTKCPILRKIERISAHTLTFVVFTENGAKDDCHRCGANHCTQLCC